MKSLYDLDDIGIASKLGNKNGNSSLKNVTKKQAVDDDPFPMVGLDDKEKQSDESGNKNVSSTNVSSSKAGSAKSKKPRRAKRSKKQMLLSASKIALANHQTRVDPALGMLLSPTTFYDEKFDRQVNGLVNDRQSHFKQSVRVDGMHVGPLLQVAVIDKFKSRFLRQKLCTEAEFDNVNQAVANSQWILLGLTDNLDTLEQRLSVALAYHQEFEQQKARFEQTRTAKIVLWSWYVMYLLRIQEVSSNGADPFESIPDEYQDMSDRQLMASVVSLLQNQQREMSRVRAATLSTQKDVRETYRSQVATRRILTANYLVNFGENIGSDPQAALSENAHVLRFDHWVESELSHWTHREATKQRTNAVHHRTN